MSIRYLRELLTARCEDVIETVDEMRRVGDLSDPSDAVIAEKTRQAAQYAAEYFRVVPEEMN